MLFKCYNFFILFLNHEKQLLEDHGMCFKLDIKSLLYYELSYLSLYIMLVINMLLAS